MNSTQFLQPHPKHMLYASILSMHILPCTTYLSTNNWYNYIIFINRNLS